MTYNWVQDNPTPYPDFDTRHRCRNFDTLLEWSEKTMPKDVPPDALDAVMLMDWMKMDIQLYPIHLHPPKIHFHPPNSS
jgi:hypothetical protein